MLFEICKIIVLSDIIFFLKNSNEIKTSEYIFNVNLLTTWCVINQYSLIISDLLQINNKIT